MNTSCDQPQKPSWCRRIAKCIARFKGYRSYATVYRRLIPLLDEGAGLRKALKEVSKQQNKCCSRSCSGSKSNCEAIGVWYRRCKATKRDPSVNSKPKLSEIMEGWLTREELAEIIHEESKGTGDHARALRGANQVTMNIGWSHESLLRVIYFSLASTILVTFAEQIKIPKSACNAVDLRILSLLLDIHPFLHVVAIAIIVVAFTAAMIYCILPTCTYCVLSSCSTVVRTFLDNRSHSIWCIYAKFTCIRIFRTMARWSHDGWSESFVDEQYLECLPEWMAWKVKRSKRLSRYARRPEMFRALGADLSKVLSRETVWQLEDMQDKVNSNTKKGLAARLHNCADAETTSVENMVTNITLLLALAIVGVVAFLKICVGGALVGWISLLFVIISLLFGLWGFFIYLALVSISVVWAISLTGS